MRCDVVVVGAGLAGLSAARDLAAAGTDVLVIEARGRAGGRVEQTRLDDGRLVQLGGELVGSFHTAYLGLVEELGLTVVPGFGEHFAEEGQDVCMLADGRVVGSDWPWFSDADRASYEATEAEFAKLAASVDPDDPWSHPDADRLDRISVGAWMRSAGATANAVRARELSTLALSAESVERTSLLSDLRKEAAAGAIGFYNYAVWEAGMVEEGSASVALRMAAELEGRIHYATPVTGIRIAAGGCSVETATGRALRVRRGRQRPAGGPAAPGRDRRGLGRSPAVTRPPAPRPGGQGVLLLPGFVLGAPRAQRHRLHGDGHDRR